MTDLRPWKPITYSCRDTDKTRAQVVDHNSVYATQKTGKVTGYRDTCPPAEKKPEAKTS